MGFTQAIVRVPGANFAQGLTSSRSGAPELARALHQHERYCDALRTCGLKITTLGADARFPDGTFVEDTAVIITPAVITTRPGAPSRAGEVSAVAAVLRACGREMHCISPPGTLDGGDVCEADGHFFIGLSARTNEAGARQLARILRGYERSSSLIDIRGNSSLLHLKSGMADLGERRLVVAPQLPGRRELEAYELIEVDPDEAYAANCVRVNAHVLIAAGHPRLSAALRSRGDSVLELDVSEFRKMDGGLSCLSLRL